MRRTTGFCVTLLASAAIIWGASEVAAQQAPSTAYGNQIQTLQRSAGPPQPSTRILGTSNVAPGSPSRPPTWVSGQSATTLSPTTAAYAGTGTLRGPTGRAPSTGILTTPPAVPGGQIGPDGCDHNIAVTMNTLRNQYVNGMVASSDMMMGRRPSSFADLSCLERLLSPGWDGFFQLPTLSDLLQSLVNWACSTLETMFYTATAPLNSAQFSSLPVNVGPIPVNLNTGGGGRVGLGRSGVNLSGNTVDGQRVNVNQPITGTPSGGIFGGSNLSTFGGYGAPSGGLGNGGLTYNPYVSPTRF
jgi:hypothetical protein